MNVVEERNLKKIMKIFLKRKVENVVVVVILIQSGNVVLDVIVVV